MLLNDNERVQVEMIPSRTVVAVTRRQAAGLYSRGIARPYVEPVKPKRRSRKRAESATETVSDLSTAAASGGQDGANAEDEPLPESGSDGLSS